MIIIINARKDGVLNFGAWHTLKDSSWVNVHIVFALLRGKEKTIEIQIL